MAKEEKLTGKQLAFVEHYIANGCNATRAAQSAGYSGNENALAVRGHGLLRNDKVVSELKRRFEKRSITAERILGQLDALAFGASDPKVRIAALRTLQQALIGSKQHVEHEVTGDIVVEGRVWGVGPDGKPVPLEEFKR
jgi:phage terminase small subunit